MANIKPARFAREVSQEAKKVTWPNRREVMVTTIMVMIMVAIMAVFFLVVDKLVTVFVDFVLTVGL